MSDLEAEIIRRSRAQARQAREEARPERLAELDEAFLLLRAGGTITLTEWRQLQPETQHALAITGEDLARRRAAWVAFFLGNPLAAAVELGIDERDPTPSTSPPKASLEEKLRSEFGQSGGGA